MLAAAPAGWPAWSTAPSGADRSCRRRSPAASPSWRPPRRCQSRPRPGTRTRPPSAGPAARAVAATA
eukprot:11200318-Lingulodinium_polyedra.AAC.1